MKEISIVEKLGKDMADYYNRQLMNVMLDAHPFLGNVKYRNQRVPRYLTVRFPSIENHSCYDDDGFTSEPSGWLITFRDVQLFRIGYKFEKVAYYPKKKQPKGNTTFKRYKPLS